MSRLREPELDAAYTGEQSNRRKRPRPATTIHRAVLFGRSLLLPQREPTLGSAVFFVSSHERWGLRGGITFSQKTRYVCSVNSLSTHPDARERFFAFCTFAGEDAANMMHGPQLLVDSLSVPSQRPDKHGNHWQYHSRSDRHSKLACWGILLDLLAHCPALRKHVESGEVAFGINHEMRDYRQNRKKNLDLVICTPADGTSKGSFSSLVEKYGVVMKPAAKKLLQELPTLNEAPVGFVRVALEAKAAMTAHVKALPRLHDELNSSHSTIHGAVEEALAAGFVMVNIAERFISPDMNKGVLSGRALQVSTHRQPSDAARVIEKIREIPRKSGKHEPGFDAIGLVVVDCVNDGRTPVKLVTKVPAPQRDDIFYYDQMIHRLAGLYKSRFG